MLAVRRRLWAKLMALVLAHLTLLGCRGPERTGGVDRDSRAVGETAASAEQASFGSPVTNTGAFIHAIPLEMPPGINGLTPTLALAYSSHGGVGIAGVGWDLPLPAITLDLADGTRPRALMDDLARYDDGTPVERYASPFGQVVAARQPSGAVTFAFDPHNDAVIEPVDDLEGRRELGGDVAAWRVRTKDGRTHLFGQRAGTAVVAEDATGADKRKVMWMLSRVEDQYGNEMKYYYEEWPLQNGRWRHPVLRAIEYGVPGSNTATTTRYVVSFTHRESPWKRSSYALGTRTDYAFNLEEVCLYARAYVNKLTSAYGNPHHVVSGSDVPEFCYQLAYHDPSTSYTDRVLLASVRKVGKNDDDMLSPWQFTYRGQGDSWLNTYAASVAAAASAPVVRFPDGAPLERTGDDATGMIVDVNGDGLVDLMRGDASGLVQLDLADPEAPTGWEHRSRPQPLAADADPVYLTGQRIVHGGLFPDETLGVSDSWYSFEYDLRYEPVDGEPGTDGYGYTQALTAAPALFSLVLGQSDPDSESEDQALDLGMFQFLRGSYRGPAPARVTTGAPRYIDELTAYGIYRDTFTKEAMFDWRTSDAQDPWGDPVELDYCWDVGRGDDGPGSSGLVGDELSCLDCRGCRWFTTSWDHAYASLLYQPDDVDGDGLIDWLYGSNLVARDASGARRSSKTNNDWFWSRGLEAPASGDEHWGPLATFHVPPKSGANLGLPALEMVHNTGLLSTSVTETDSATPASAHGFAVSLGVSPGGFGVSASAIVGGVGLPVAGLSAGWSGAGSISFGGVSTGTSQHALAGAVATSAASVGLGAGYGRVAGHLSTPVGSAAESAMAVTSSGSVLSTLSLGLTFSVVGRVPRVSLTIPFVGDVFKLGRSESYDSVTRQFQGLADLTGDGRPDYVSARFDTSAGLNAENQWLFYRNDGTKLEDPVYWEFDDMPSIALPVDNPPGMSVVNNVNYVYNWVWWAPGDATGSFGRTEQWAGFMDLNGDSLADYVISDGYQIGTRDAWQVHFNTGGGFTEARDWVFDGEWPRPGSCPIDGRHQPFLMLTVYGVRGDNTEVFHENPNELGLTRQTQGTMDVNGDGLLDYWAEPPTEGWEDGSCDYLNEASDNLGYAALLGRVDPFELEAPLYVWLNNGNGFDAPAEWIGTNGYSMSGGVFLAGTVPQGMTIIGAGDHDADGHPDLAVSTGWANDVTPFYAGVEQDFALFRLGDGSADLLESIVLPQGGKIEVEYEHVVEPRGALGRGQWVLSEMMVKDVDPSGGANGDGVLARTHYAYERGVYDREERAYRGFERVYQYNDGDAGYTMTRYYQDKGLEGLEYCREVRALDGDVAAEVTGQVHDHVVEWGRTPAGSIPAGYVPAVALGDATILDATNGPTPAEDEDPTLEDLAEVESSEGPTPDTHLPYAGAPASTGGEDDSMDLENGMPIADDPVEPPSAHSGGPATGFNTVPPLDSDGGEPTSTDPIGPTESVADRPPSLFDPCDTPGLVETGTVDLYCDPAPVISSVTVCGDVDDVGRLVKQEFHVYQNYSRVVGLDAPRETVTIEYLYDADGTDPRKTVRVRAYDDDGSIVVDEDRGDEAVPGDELVTRTTFAATNRNKWLLGLPCVIETTDLTGATVYSRTEHGYDGAAAASCTMPSKGALTATRRRIAGTTFADEGFAYTANGMLQSKTDPRGNVTSYEYDATFPWFKTRENLPLGLSRRWTYMGVPSWSSGVFGTPLTEIDENGAVTTFAADALGRRTAVIRPYSNASRPTSSTEYVDTLPNQTITTTVIDATKERIEVVTFDGLGRVARSESSPGMNAAGCHETSGCRVVTAEHRYDASGRQITTRLPYFMNDTGPALEVTHAHDLLGRIVEVVGADGSCSITTFDREVMTTIDALDHVVVTTSDAKDRPVRIEERDGATVARLTLKRHRPDGKLAEMEDAAGNVWRFQYDDLGRQILAEDPDTGEQHVIYDAAGNAVVVYDARYAAGSPTSRAVKMTYDALNRPTRRSEYTGAIVFAATANVVGTEVARTDWVYDVDPAERPDPILTCNLTNPWWKGRLTSAIRSEYIVGTLQQVSREDFCYDARGRVTQRTRDVAGSRYPFEYTYNHADLATGTAYPDGDLVVRNYDARGNMFVMISNQAGILLRDVLRGPEGEVVSRTFGPAGPVELTCYEPGAQRMRPVRQLVADDGVELDCVTSMPVIPGDLQYDVLMTYDDEGLPLQRVERFADLAGGAPDVHTTLFGHDPLHRLAQEEVDGDLTTFTYDSLDNLTAIGSVTQSYGVGTGPHQLASTSAGDSFTYDAAGNVKTWSSAGVTTTFLHDAANLPTQISALGRPTTIYRYGPSGDRVLKDVGGTITHYAGDGVRVNAVGTPSESVETRFAGVGVKESQGGTHAPYFTVADLVGSTSVVVDGAGAVVQLRRYEPYGRTREEADTGGYVTDHLFNGKELEDDVYGPGQEVYDFGARLYNAATGRWLNQDTTFADGLNRYAFVRNSPARFPDPTGRAAPILAGGWVIVETGGTVVSIGLGVGEMVVFGPTPMGIAGVGYDAYSLVVPGLPGGVGAGRAGVRLVEWLGPDAVVWTSRQGDNIAWLLKQCFAAGTPVHTADGPRPIEEVEAGTLVWSRDPRTGAPTLAPVARGFVTEGREIAEVTVGGEVLRVTLGHPFWVDGRGWIAAAALAPGDRVSLLDGAQARVESLRLTGERTTVYNLEVAGTHSYFAGEAGVWVHNACLQEVYARFQQVMAAAPPEVQALFVELNELAVDAPWDVTWFVDRANEMIPNYPVNLAVLNDYAEQVGLPIVNGRVQMTPEQLRALPNNVRAAIRELYDDTDAQRLVDGAINAGFEDPY